MERLIKTVDSIIDVLDKAFEDGMVSVKKFKDASKKEARVLRRWFEEFADSGPQDSFKVFARKLDEVLHGTVIGDTVFVDSKMKNRFVLYHEGLHWMRYQVDEDSRIILDDEDDAGDDEYKHRLKNQIVLEEQLCFVIQAFGFIEDDSITRQKIMSYVRSRLIDGDYVTKAQYNKHKRGFDELVDILEWTLKEFKRKKRKGTLGEF